MQHMKTNHQYCPTFNKIRNNNNNSSTTHTFPVTVAAALLGSCYCWWICFLLCAPSSKHFCANFFQLHIVTRRTLCACYFAFSTVQKDPFPSMSRRSVKRLPHCIHAKCQFWGSTTGNGPGTNSVARENQSARPSYGRFLWEYVCMFIISLSIHAISCHNQETHTVCILF